MAQARACLNRELREKRARTEWEYRIVTDIGKVVGEDSQEYWTQFQLQQIMRAEGS